MITKTAKLSYRPVCKDDYEFICSLPRNPEELFFMFPKAVYPLTIHQLESAVSTRYNSTVILYGEVIAGFANFYEMVENEYCSIGNVIVNPEYRNQGIGKFIIETMEHIAHEKYNVSEYRLSCFNTNTNGILLYTKLGYRPYEIERYTNRDNEAFALIEMKRER